MNKFSWYNASTVEDALKKVDSTVSATITKTPNTAAVVKSGGVDLLDLMKEGLVAPKMIVNIRDIPGLDKASYDKKEGLRLGANVTLAQMEELPEVKSQYKALYQAILSAATPQLRYMASLGGNLAQRTRCWYFRSADHPCFRKGGNICFAKNGENEFHSVMNNGMCSSVHASSIATALMAFNTRVEITNKDGKTKEVSLNEFFVPPWVDISRENILEANELITAVIIPPANKNTKSNYLKQGARASYDWALADVAVVLETSGSTCKNASVVLGAAAPVPVSSKPAADALIGKRINESSARSAAEASMKDATPLAQNAYKVPLFKTIVRRAILETV